MESHIEEGLHARIEFLSAHRDRLVIDADTHITDLDRLEPKIAERLHSTPNYYHGRPISAEWLLQEMRLAQVDMALCWQNPAATPYTADKDRNYEVLLAANRYVFESARKYSTKIIPAGWTDPKALGLDNALRLVDTCIDQFGFAFVKMNPAQNAFPIDSDDVLTIVDRIVERGSIPAFHFGADTPFTPAEGLERVALRHPEHPVLAIHMGGGGAGYVEADTLYAQARELGLRRPNIHYALSAKRDTHIESDLITYQMTGAPFSQNLSCASDAPYGKLTWNFGGFRLMFEGLKNAAEHPDLRIKEHPGLFTDEAVTNYLGRNFADLTIRGSRYLLAVNTSGTLEKTL